ncbi:MAG: MSHA biogenesis protein MshG [Candidatus Azotimanducaceae bacterium]|jgi:MSHA biogenesis protein MshG
MSTYAYKVRDGQGKTIVGKIHAANDDAAATELIGSGLTPILIEEVADKSTEEFDLNSLFRSRKIELEELIMFSRQMYSLSKAGIPLLRALNGLMESSTNEKLKETINELASDLEGGHPLAHAMSGHPNVFSDLYVSIIHVGENSGRLEEAFQQIAAYLELERETMKRIKSATRYPTFVIIAMGIGLVIINIFVLPAFSGVFEKMGAELPWQTKLLMSGSNFMLEYWPFLLGGFAMITLGVRRWVSTDKGRLIWHRWKLRLPLVGGLFERIHLGRFCRSFSMMLKSGVPIIQGLNVVSYALGNDHMAGYVRAMRISIERGESFLQASIASKLFTPLVLQMISVGEETGGVDEMLGEAADFYEQEVDYELKGLADAIEPVLIIGIGAMILVLALGVFLPLWDLSSAASARG